MMRVYLDNVAASGRVVGDLTPAEEMEALRRIESAHSAGIIKIVTSRESWREQERTTNPVKRAKLEAARSEVSVVANDHVVLGFFSPLTNRYGSVVIAPIITDIVDEALFADLRGLGLDDSDAKHLSSSPVEEVGVERDEAIAGVCHCVHQVFGASGLTTRTPNT